MRSRPDPQGPGAGHRRQLDPSRLAPDGGTGRQPGTLRPGPSGPAELAGLQLTNKRLERSAEADGARVLAAAERQAEAVLAGIVVPFSSTEPVENLYIAMDGTGVPTVPADTEGRRGKSPDGRAHTREAKLGCLFTQTTVNGKGGPVRDPGSSSYIATMKTATGTQRWPTLTLGGAEEQKSQEVLTHPAGGPDVRNSPAPHTNSHTNKRAAEGGSKRT